MIQVAERVKEGTKWHEGGIRDGREDAEDFFKMDFSCLSPLNKNIHYFQFNPTLSHNPSYGLPHPINQP
jgi:hypothetical protein